MLSAIWKACVPLHFFELDTIQQIDREYKFLNFRNFIQLNRILLFRKTQILLRFKFKNLFD